jgi:2-methylisocitrate lyase-like PEP mutase family enzyme
MSASRDAQVARAEDLRSLHAGADPLRLANAWDATSARVLAAAGARAIGTTSFGIALDNATWDGELLPLDALLEVARAIAGAVEVPVSVDLEAGRGETAADVGRAVTAVLDCGAVGVNIEDAIPGQQGVLRDVDEQSARIAAARDAATAAGIPLFINARCDVWFGADVAADDRIDEALHRAAAYEAAGADGLFLPGLLDPGVLTVVTAKTALPVNVMVGAMSPPIDQLIAAGVRRISQGGEPFLAMAGALKLATERYLAGDLGPTDVVGAGMSLIPDLVRPAT